MPSKQMDDTLSSLKALGTGVGQGMSAGTSKYVSAGLAWLADCARNIMNSTPGITWDQAVQYAGQEQQALAQQHPVATTAGQVAGSLVPGYGTAALAAKFPAASAGINIYSGAAQGALQAMSSGQDPMTGAFVGGIGGIAGEGVSMLGQKATDALKQQFGDKVAKQLSTTLLDRMNTKDALAKLGVAADGMTSADLDFISSLRKADPKGWWKNASPAIKAGIKSGGFNLSHDPSTAAGAIGALADKTNPGVFRLPQQTAQTLANGPAGTGLAGMAARNPDMLSTAGSYLPGAFGTLAAPGQYTGNTEGQQ